MIYEYPDPNAAIRQGDIFAGLPRVEMSLRELSLMNDVADEHFRERLAEFFRRYPYDEWYPLNEQEFAEYKKSYPDAQPFPWQSATASS